MIGWQDDKRWSDRFLPQIKKIVGPLLLEESPMEMDQKEATDLKIIKARDLRIACRVRSHGYADSYPYDFTIRSSRPSGNQTELEKILSGFADLNFYGHADKEGNIVRYMVLDLDVFRYAMSVDQEQRWIKSTQKPNQDRSSLFIAFNACSFPSNMILASSHPIPNLYAEAA